MTRYLRLAFLLFLILAAGWLLLRHEALLPRFSNPFVAQPIQVDQTPALVTHIRALAQLVSIEYLDEVVVDSSRGSAQLVPLPPFMLPVQTRLVLVVQGRIRAGVNLQGLDSTHFSGTTDSVVVRLPRAQILEAIVNPTDVEVFSEKGNWNQQAVAALKIKARNLMIRNALAQGVLHRANEKAVTLVEQLMRNAGYKKITVLQ